ncbi:hypothetical protein Ndes2526B_g09359 [Nannochloris sp. 'desiccata']|nr:hypothetical protein KSW81_003613 [Chlorella desiccata (nom. nud.)]
MEPGSSPGGVNSPSNQFQQFFNPHMNADVSPGTKKKQQDASLDALIGELDTSYIDLPELIPHDGEEEQANVVQKD